jgi:hypothetical protein
MLYRYIDLYDILYIIKCPTSKIWSDDVTKFRSWELLNRAYE